MCDRTNLASGQMLLHTILRRTLSSVTTATCRRLPEAESGSGERGDCPFPSLWPRIRPGLPSRWDPLGSPGRPGGRQGAGCLACLVSEDDDRPYTLIPPSSISSKFFCDSLYFPKIAHFICFLTLSSQATALVCLVCCCVPGTSTDRSRLPVNICRTRDWVWEDGSC